MSLIFISHSSKDNIAAQAMRDWLAEVGWDDVFLDLDPDRGIAAGERWERALHQAAFSCEAVIFLVSAAWLGSGWCLKEYALARSLNKKLFAAIIDGEKSIDDLPPELKGTWQVVDLAHGQDHRLFRVALAGSHEEAHVTFSQEGLRRLKRGLDKAGLDPRFFAWPPAGEAERAPYRGLRPLEAEDAGIFFGREGPIIDATDRLRGLAAGAPPRLMVILGASGAGKSSFLRAGLLPRLARDDWHFLPLPVIRPQSHPLTGESGLLGALEGALPNRSRAELRAAIGDGAKALRPMLSELAATGRRALADDQEQANPAIVLAIDQAEELFSADAAAEGAALLRIVAELTATDAPAVLVLFTIRSDNYDALERADALAGLRQTTLPLLPMPRGTYKEVIEGPARRSTDAGHQLTVEPQLTERLLADIERGGGIDALPLLGFTLEQLYVEYGRARGALRLADYEAFGGIAGAIHAAVERALAKADADPRIPRDRMARELLLRRGLIPWLAGIDPDTRSPRRMRARRSEIPAEAAPLIDLLIEERLLTTDTVSEPDAETGAETRIATIEPAHEALLRQWGILEGWLAEDFAFLATLEGVKRASRDWAANGRSPDWLAHQGERLADAQALDTRPDLAGKFDASDRGYLAACRAREEELRAEAEKRRQERDQEQARRLANAQALATANRRTAQRTRIGLVAALVLAVAATGLAIVALQQQKAAEAAQVVAVEQKSAALAAEATAQQQRSVAEAAEKEAQAQKTRAENALNAAVSTANTLVTNLAQQFRNTTGMPESLVDAILEQAQQLEDHLVAAGEDDPLLQRSEVTTLNELARAAIWAGKTDLGKQDAGKALAISEQLSKAKPDDRGLQRDVAVSLGYFAEVERGIGLGPASLRDYTRELAIFQQLAQTKSDAEAQSDYATLLESVGDMKMENGDVPGGTADLKQSFALTLPIAAANKTDLFVQRRLANLYDDLGDAEQASGDAAGALADYQEAVSRFQVLAQNKSDSLSQQGWALALDKVGDAELQAGNAATAITTYSSALAIRQGLAGDTSNPLAQSDLAESLVKLGDAKAATGDFKSALADYLKALPLRRQTAGDANSYYSQAKLAVTLERIGDTDLHLGDKVSAKPAYAEELTITQGLADKEKTPQPEMELAEALYRMAYVDDTPRDDLNRAISILDPLDKAGELSPADKTLLANMRRMIQIVDQQEAAPASPSSPAPANAPAAAPAAPAASIPVAPASSATDSPSG